MHSVCPFSALALLRVRIRCLLFSAGKSFYFEIVCDVWKLCWNCARMQIADMLSSLWARPRMLLPWYIVMLMTTWIQHEASYLYYSNVATTIVLIVSYKTLTPLSIKTWSEHHFEHTFHKLNSRGFRFTRQINHSSQQKQTLHQQQDNNHRQWTSRGIFVVYQTQSFSTSTHWYIENEIPHFIDFFLPQHIITFVNTNCIVNNFGRCMHRAHMVGFETIHTNNTKKGVGETVKNTTMF